MMKGQLLRTGFGILAAAAGFCAALWFMGCGIDFMDEPYELMNAARPLDCPLAPLSALAGHLALDVPDVTIRAARFFSLLVTLASIALATLCCSGRLRQGYAVLTFGVAVLIAAPYVESWLYGWDIFSNAALTLTLAWLCVPCGRYPYAHAVTSGVLAGLATLCRVPDILVLPAVLFVVGNMNGKNNYAAVTWALGAFVAVVAGFLLLVYGTPAAYLQAIAENTPGAHGLSTLIVRTFSGAVWFAPLLWSSIGLFLLVCFAGRRFGFRSARFALLSIAGAVVLALIFRLTVWKYTVVQQMAECIVIPLLLHPLFRRRSCDRATRILAIAALWTGLCAIAGSNTGFTKFLSIGLFPVAVAQSRPRESRSLRVWLALMIAVYCCVGGYVRCVEGYKDVGACRIEARVPAGHPMEQLGSTERFASYALGAQSLTRKLEKEGYEIRVLGTGLNRFGWLYITGSRQPGLRHQWDADALSMQGSEELRAAVDEALSLPKVAVIVPAPFEGEVQCEAFGPYDEDLVAALGARLSEVPAGVEGVRLFCSVAPQ